MLEQMIEKGSRDPFVWYARALELRTASSESAALSALKTVEAEFPDYVPAYLMAGQIAEALGDREAAHLTFNRGIEVAQAAAKRGEPAGHALSELEAGALRTAGA